MTTALAQKPDFGLGEIEIAGCDLVLDPRGCLYWPNEKLLIISDLHLEKGSSFAARKSVFMPPYDTAATLEMLAACIAEWQPKTVISLGDSFHDEHADERLSRHSVDQITSMMAGREWVWISGNHDPKPPEALGGMFSTSLDIGVLNFTHEPLIEFRDGEIAGHLHPAAKIRRRGKSVRRRCAIGDGRRLILPAFGAFTGGLNVRDEAFSGLFDKPTLKAWMLGNRAVYPVSAKQTVK